MTGSKLRLMNVVLKFFLWSVSASPFIFLLSSFIYIWSRITDIDVTKTERLSVVLAPFNYLALFVLTLALLSFTYAQTMQPWEKDRKKLIETGKRFTHALILMSVGFSLIAFNILILPENFVYTGSSEPLDVYTIAPGRLLILSVQILPSMMGIPPVLSALSMISSELRNLLNMVR